MFPEGNAHQAEFTRNNRWIIGTDEDFSPFRLLNDSFSITSGPNAGSYSGGEFADGPDPDVPGQPDQRADHLRRLRVS